MRSLAKLYLPDATHHLQRLLSQLLPGHEANDRVVDPFTAVAPSITPDDSGAASNAHARAEYATLKAFLNGYMLEITAGHVAADNGDTPTVIEFDLPRSFVRLRVTLRHWSLTGPHDFNALFLRNSEGGSWRQASVGVVLPMLVRDCFARSNAPDGPKMHELLRRILNSYDQIAKCCAHADAMPAAPLAFLAGEQSLSFGHWLHPTPKSREGMTDWQAAAYAPEFGGAFQLRFFAARDDIALSGSARPCTAQEMIRDIPEIDAIIFELGPDEQLVPMHPLQADALCLQPDVQSLLKSGVLRDLGTAGASFSATSSVRTVYAPGCPWMFKFSLPVKITNSHRINLHHELEAGVVMAGLLDKTGFLDRQPRFDVINDPGFVTVTLPGHRESGFEVIIRENPFASETTRVVTVAALTADPPTTERSMLARLIAETAKRYQISEAKAAAQWFTAYLDCALHPALALYDEFGIALEAHQQNSLLDVHQGFPRRYLFRDNQGYYISEKSIAELAQLEPRVTALESVCFSETEIRDRFGYYLVLNQIFSVISRLSRDGFVPEVELLGQLQQALRKAEKTYSGPAKRFANHLLTAPDLAFKANLLTRVHDVDELRAEDERAIYTRRKNPISQGQIILNTRVPHVTA